MHLSVAGTKNTGVLYYGLKPTSTITWTKAGCPCYKHLPFPNIQVVTVLSLLLLPSYLQKYLVIIFLTLILLKRNLNCNQGVLIHLTRLLKKLLSAAFT